MGIFSTLLAAFLLVAAPADPAAEDTRELLDTAATQYETSQYDEAVATYTQAYQLSRSIEDQELRGLVQAAILFNLAQAHSKAYALDKDPEHLLLAIDLLEKYLAQTADLADQADAERLLEQTRVELAQVEERRAAEQRASEQPEPEPEPLPTTIDEDARPRKLRIGGAALVGLGVAASGLAIGGVALADRAEADYIVGPTRDDRDAAERAGRTANAMIVAGSVTAGVLVTVGVALLVAGRKRPAVSPSAWLTPTGAGIAFGGRF